MKKILIRHISFIFLFTVIIISLWVIFIYAFFDNEMKKTIYPTIEDSKQILSEIVTKDFAKDKIKKIIADFEKSENILHLTLTDKDKNISFHNSNSAFSSMLCLSYPIKKGKEIVGWVNVWPSYELFAKIFSKSTNIIVFLVSVIFVLLIFIVVSYIYVTKYIISPFKQIKIMINNIISDKDAIVDADVARGIWKSVFSDLKKLNNKVLDVNTTMKLLFSATNIINSDLELINSIHLIFNIIQKKINNTICVLFVISEDGQLKVVAKNSYSDGGIKSIRQNSNSPVWSCYEKCSEIFVDDISCVSKDEVDGFYDKNLRAQLNIPLTDENGVCVGVFSVSGRDKNTFDNDAIETIKKVSKYLEALIIKMKDYKKIKETNRKLETEIQTTSKELISTNAMLIKKIRDIRAISDISSYASTKFDMEDIIAYIIDKIKEIIAVETAGVFIYSRTKDEFYSVKGSFEIYKVLNYKNEKGTVCNEVFNSKSSVIINGKNELKKYPNSRLEEYLKLNSVVFSPVKGEDGIVAVLVAVNKIGMNFIESDVRALGHVAVIISSIIEKIKLYSKLKSDLKMGEANGNC